MPPPRAQERATTRARTPRVIYRIVEKLTRVRERSGDSTSRTLHFTMSNRTRTRSLSTFINPQDVPEFGGDEAWFEMEQVERGAGHASTWWRAVRQVEPPAGAR